jgi:peptide/nickel transport system permease protein
MKHIQVRSIENPPAQPNGAPNSLHKAAAWGLQGLTSLRPKIIFSIIVLSLVVFSALTADWISPFDPIEVKVSFRLQPPMWEDPLGRIHLLGTDPLGRDIASRLIYGTRISLIVGLASVLIGGILGLILGVVSGFYGGVIDDIIMRLGDIQLAFPNILLFVAILAVMGSGVLNIVLILGFTGWIQYARITRGQVLALRESEFVTAAKALGCHNMRIIIRNIIPHTLSPLIVIASFAVANNIIIESSLSFLGLGVPPAIPSWGTMLADGRQYIRQAWWPVTFPGLAIMITILSINLLGDALRDYLDPRLGRSESTL